MSERTIQLTNLLMFFSMSFLHVLIVGGLLNRLEDTPTSVPYRLPTRGVQGENNIGPLGDLLGSQVDCQKRW